MAIKTEGIKVKVNGKEFGCLTGIGEIKQTRDVNTKTCLANGEVITSLGSIKTDNIALDVDYDPNDALGAGEAENVFNSGSECLFEIELSDTAGNNGTTFKWTKAKISEFTVNPNDNGDVTASFTLVPGGKPEVIAAS